VLAETGLLETRCRADQCRQKHDRLNILASSREKPQFKETTTKNWLIGSQVAIPKCVKQPHRMVGSEVLVQPSKVKENQKFPAEYMELERQVLVCTKKTNGFGSGFFAITNVTKAVVADVQSRLEKEGFPQKRQRNIARFFSEPKCVGRKAGFTEVQCPSGVSFQLAVAWNRKGGSSRHSVAFRTTQ